MKPSLPLIIALVGPTASGKTDMAIRLAKAFHGFIVSADSRQIYRSMDIGTAKPRLSLPHFPCQQLAYTLSGVLHFMFNILDPFESYSVAEYQKTVYGILECMKKKSPTSLPFLVGGTGLYVDAVLQHWIIPATVDSSDMRKRLEKHTLAYLAKKIQLLDPETAARIDKMNKRRLVRALEFILSTHTSFFQAQRKGPEKFRSLVLGLEVPRTELYQRIEKRVDAMIEAGLLVEVERLAKKYAWDAPGLYAIGYRQFRGYFEGKTSLEGVTNQLKRDTKHYAKRQLSWFRRSKKIIWIQNFSEGKKAVERFLSA